MLARRVSCLAAPRVQAGFAPGKRPVAPEHLVPLVLFLASQDGRGVTGRMYDALEWNSEHGQGGYDVWCGRSLRFMLDEDSE